MKSSRIICLEVLELVGIFFFLLSVCERSSGRFDEEHSKDEVDG